MIGLHKNDVSLLRCPDCLKKVKWDGSDSDDWIQNGVLECDKKHIWRVRSGVADLANRTGFSCRERLLDTLFDILAPVHDLSVNYLLPVLQYPDPDASV